MKMIDNWLARPIEEVKMPCYYCGGRGKVYEMNAYDEEAWVTCGDCNGDGYILKEGNNVSIRIMERIQR